MADSFYALQFTLVRPGHLFGWACQEQDIERCLTKDKHPWIWGQVERMNRITKEATAKRFDYDDRAQLRQRLGNFIDAYNYGHRLKPLKGLAPMSSSADSEHPSG